MATRKRPRATPKGKKGPARPAAKRTAARAKAPAARRKAPARPRLKQRQDPETLRLRGFEPSLTANDLQESIRFYTDVLGFFMGERWMDGGVLRGVSLKAGVCRLGLSQDDWKKGRDRRKGEGIRLYCETAQDIDALAARIRNAGGRLVEEPHDQGRGRARPHGGRSRRFPAVDLQGEVGSSYSARKIVSPYTADATRKCPQDGLPGPLHRRRVHPVVGDQEGYAGQATDRCDHGAPSLRETAPGSPAPSPPHPVPRRQG